jgi:lipopolysaccharide transport system permease protein
LNKELPQVRYTPESQLHHPTRLFQAMWRDLFASNELACRLFIRNISAMYRQTILGYLWFFLPPIFTTLTFVFLNSQKIITVGQTDIPYPAYVMINTILWQVFVDSINSPLKLINQCKSFLAKINFPRESLILAGVGEVLFNFSIRLILLFIVFAWYKISPPATAFLTPLGILALVGLGFTFGILIAPFGVLYQDVEKGLPFITAIWFFFTPILYPIPTSWPASVVFTLNPVSPFLVTTREMMTTGSFSQLTVFWVIVCMTVTLLFLGWVLYRIALPHLTERMSA